MINTKPPVYLRVWLFITLFLVGFFGVLVTPLSLLFWPADIFLVVLRIKWALQNRKNKSSIPTPAPEAPANPTSSKISGVDISEIPIAQTISTENMPLQAQGHDPTHSDQKSEEAAQDIAPVPESTDLAARSALHEKEIAMEQSNPVAAPTDDPCPPTRAKIERHRVAGTSYRQKEIESIGIPNSSYDMTKGEIIDCLLTDERIYQYEFSGLEANLVEEPDNPYDSNAIKVVVDGVHIGYIKKGSCAHIKRLMKANKIISVHAEISGGKFKLVYSDDDYGNERYTLKRDRRDYFANLSIAVRTDLVS